MNLSVASFIVGTLGILLALYQGFEKRKLSRYLRSQSWYIYSMSLLSWASAQAALKKYKEIASDKLQPDIFENLSKCDALNLSLSLEAIRQIQLSEPRFDVETIMLWAAQGKIPKEHTPQFLRILSVEPLNIFSFVWQSFKTKWIMKLQKKAIDRVPKPSDSQEDSEPKSEIGKP
jgi:hypothetical protein